MNIRSRKPVRHRFRVDPKEIKLARYKQQAPTLSSGGNRVRWYAMMGSAVMLLTIIGLYFAAEIAKAADERRAAGFIEVDGEAAYTPPQRVLLEARLKAEEDAAQLEYEQAMRKLREFELPADLEDLPLTQDQDVTTGRDLIEQSDQIVIPQE